MTPMCNELSLLLWLLPGLLVIVPFGFIIWYAIDDCLYTLNPDVANLKEELRTKQKKRKLLRKYRKGKRI